MKILCTMMCLTLVSIAARADAMRPEAVKGPGYASCEPDAMRFFIAYDGDGDGYFDGEIAIMGSGVIRRARGGCWVDTIGTVSVSPCTDWDLGPVRQTLTAHGYDFSVSLITPDGIELCRIVYDGADPRATCGAKPR